MTRAEMEAIAERINTGTDNSETSRALIVFNLTDKPISGVAAFSASMSWLLGVPLPPGAVTDFDSNPVASAIYDLGLGPDTKGRADRCQLSFNLRFAASDVPAHGWRTYIASYTKTAAEQAELGLGAVELVVIETLRHSGDLPPTGTF